ncbi:MAG: helix-hairpin-helix domain-containing protein [Desulfobulbaceae bacterium]|nr:helix-hairpin-helix domain-containing protein [Desulfobulbaceae bacterium]
MKSKAKDHRVLVLLVVSISISIFHLTGIIRPDWEKRINPQPGPSSFDIVWLKGGNITEGLYYLPQAESGNNSKSAAPAGPIPTPLSAIPPKAAPLFFMPIPINEADAELLTIIPGIGPSLAARIIDFREQRGRIENLDQLLKVHGIGKVKLKTLRRHVTS